MAFRHIVTGFALCAALAATGAWTRTAAAQRGEIAAVAIGPRVGVGITPDQLVLGGHLNFGGFHPDWTLSPIIELGFGDHVTVISLDFDAYYHVHLQDSDWKPYVGGGVSLNNFNFDVEPPFRHDSETEAGINVVLGTTIPTSPSAPMFTEVRIGFGDIPDFHAMVGWNFALRR